MQLIWSEPLLGGFHVGSSAFENIFSDVDSFLKFLGSGLFLAEYRIVVRFYMAYRDFRAG